jgi:tight adherence protein B
VVTPAAVAAATVLTVAWASHGTARHWAAERARARFDTAAPAPVGPPWVERALESAGIGLHAGTALHLWGAAVVVGLAAQVAMGGGPVLLGASVAGPPLAVALARGRADRLRARQLPLALDAVAAGMRGGASLGTAISEAASGDGALAAELRRVAGHARAGRPLTETLSEWATARPDAHTRLAAAALAVAAELGGPGADAVEAAAASLRERAVVDDEVAALSVQARLSAVLLTAAPLVFAFLLSSIDPTSAEFLFRTRAGWVCIAVGLVLDALGALWMSRLVGRAR